MGLNIERIELLLLVAAVVAMLARRLRLPYTVGLVAAGATLVIARVGPDVPLTRDLIFRALLPPLVFEAALYIQWKELRRDLPIILTLATLGVLLSAGITAAGMHYLVGWSWAGALVFGALIAATDPVSVVALFKELAVRGRLKLLIEAESLLNDGSAAVAFAIAVALATGSQLSGAGIAWEAFRMIAGGLVCGGAVAAGILLLAGRTTDHLVEITFTTVAAYGSFLLAEHFHVSGVLAALTAGLITGNVGPLGAISARGREAVESFWEYAAFVTNSLIFLLIGMREAHEHVLPILKHAAAAVGFVLLGRAVAVYPCCAIFARTRWRVGLRTQLVLFWGGLRGALALALVLGTPRSIPERGVITSVAFAVVAFSVVVQGMTMMPLLRKIRADGE